MKFIINVFVESINYSLLRTDLVEQEFYELLNLPHTIRLIDV